MNHNDSFPRALAIEQCIRIIDTHRCPSNNCVDCFAFSRNCGYDRVSRVSMAKKYLIKNCTEEELMENLL